MTTLRAIGLLTFTTAVFAACSVDTKPIEDDDGSTPTSGSGGSGSTVTATSTGTSTVTASVSSSASGMMAGCAGATCEECINTQCAQLEACATESQACQSNMACTDLNSCWSNCGQDQACFDTCNTTHAGGVADLEALYTCLQCTTDACAAQCQAQSPFCL